MRNSILNFVEENNIDDINKVYDQFGDPRDIAEQSISDTEPQKIKRNFKHHKIVIIGVVVAVLIVAVVIIWAAFDGHKSSDGYYVETVGSASEAAVKNTTTNNID